VTAGPAAGRSRAPAPWAVTCACGWAAAGQTPAEAAALVDIHTWACGIGPTVRPGVPDQPGPHPVEAGRVDIWR
jgi:hypothetical protein